MDILLFNSIKWHVHVECTRQDKLYKVSCALSNALYILTSYFKQQSLSVVFEKGVLTLLHRLLVAQGFWSTHFFFFDAFLGVAVLVTPPLCLH